MLNWSFIDPPGCITAVIPAFFAISTQSGKGKKASLAIEAPSKLNPKTVAFSIACNKASTLEVCPVPDEIKVPFFANTMVFDLVFLHTLEAKIKSSNSCEDGAVNVTTFKPALVSVMLFLS